MKLSQLIRLIAPTLKQTAPNPMKPLAVAQTPKPAEKSGKTDTGEGMISDAMLYNSMQHTKYVGDCYDDGHGSD